MLNSWMKEYNSKKWSLGCHFVASEKNNRFHEGVKNTPYVLMYGQRMRVGLSSLNLSPELLSKLETEDQLRSLLSVPSSTTVPIEVNLAEHHRNADLSCSDDEEHADEEDSIMSDAYDITQSLALNDDTTQLQGIWYTYILIILLIAL